MGVSKWMLSTIATVVSKDPDQQVIMASNFTLHLWHTGDVYIKETDRPLLISTPNDDLQELKEWCEYNGWKRLLVDNNLVESPADFYGWMNLYRAGIISNEKLEKSDVEEMKRFGAAAAKESSAAEMETDAD
jgi:hypothetical protein